jgi:hypothetical protein
MRVSKITDQYKINMPELNFLTQLNDDVYEIVQLDMIEQYRTHHLMLDMLFQDKVVMIGLNKLVHQNN